MTTATGQPSAGSAEPNWFEWHIGLQQLIEMLDEDSAVVEVAFQLYGTKGWDDVGVRFRDGTTRLFQIKHSRSGDRLTFGDLITEESTGTPSLLRALARAWKSEIKSRTSVECVLLTNRSAGPNWWQDRPPLTEFLNKLNERLAGATLPDDISWEGEDPRFVGAWRLFIGELDDLEPMEIIEFLRQVSIKVDAPDSEKLETRIRARLTELSGLPQSSVGALFNTLIANLSRWTCHTRRKTEWIDPEVLRSCIASGENEPRWLGHCEVETPEPFFPSRHHVVDALRRSLLSDSKYKVAFLSAEPGAGKTSCISKLARCGSVLWKENCVSHECPVITQTNSIGWDQDHHKFCGRIPQVVHLE